MIVLFLFACCSPALFFSCTPDILYKDEPDRDLPSDDATVPTRMNISTPASIRIETCDILVYDSGPFGRLDSRTVIKSAGMRQMPLEITSGNGDKIFVALCNLPEGFLQWEDIITIHALRQLTASLENESEDCPILCGELGSPAGTGISLRLNPLTARIRLGKVSCDFGGTAYSGETVTDVKVYLTNVNADCGLLPDSEQRYRFINNGAYNYSDCAVFKDRNLLIKDITGGIGNQEREAGLDFFCYPNPNRKESFGQPLTRLVIEGNVAGHKWYWPIELCLLSDNGIEAGMTYEISLRLLRTGTDNPDIPVSISENNMTIEVLRWKEKENHSVSF